MTTSQNEETQSVVVSGDNMHGKHHCEVLIMNRAADGPGGAGNYYNSLGVVDDVPDEEFDARFRALDPEKLRQEYGGDAVRFNGPRRFLRSGPWPPTPPPTSTSSPTRRTGTRSATTPPT